MGYLHIDNLYRADAQRILEFKRVYAMEKIHGTSAHIRWEDGKLSFFSGGTAHEQFVALFNEGELACIFSEKFGVQPEQVVVYGEAYGGKMHGMRETYGDQLRFVAFDVKIDSKWLSVDQAAGFVRSLGLEFVDYALIPATLEALDAERDKPSTQALRNLGKTDAIREGVVIRPPFELTLNNGARLIAKHKREEFSERKSVPRIVSPEKLEKLTAAEAIVEEWVTAERLNHVLDHIIARKTLGSEPEIWWTGTVIKEMAEDVRREAGVDGEHPEIVWGKEVEKALGQATAKMFKARLIAKLNERSE